MGEHRYVLEPGKGSNWVATSITVVLAMVFLIPFFWLASTAFKPTPQIFSLPLTLWPHPPTLEHLKRTLFEFPFFMYFRNTLLVTILTVAGTLLSCLPVAYALSILEWPDKKLLFGLLMATLILPPQVTLIPTFLLYRQLGWIDTYAPLLVPCLLGNAFFIFLLRQFFNGFPRAIIESARIDGALEPVILARIVVPLCKPPLLTVTLFSGIGAWNDFVGPLIYLSSESKKTLALGLQSFMGQFSSEWGMLMAASLLMATPVIILFLVAQRQFVEGIAMSGMKG